ncbi:peptidylprolyl isomerase [Mucilaginibacter pallidiroseus]|uniref:Peptidyl-prolyl cis-trans isomerase n=1 Tax=Mucilaginibacter pallidiroseus TaxID=2599295 RepID=A0A563UD26_9SPHI|nr:peptidylprolyl isomerase [Mucilaginibacter pallidiroseus]TWR29183.1 peptidylprolyl isomerase [Mucilaginibacter pallidiroseus]
MKKSIILLLILGFTYTLALAHQKGRYVKVETPQGWCIIKLYNETPKHRDNFIKLVKARYFDATTFNRILKKFVIQGGDQDSLYEKGRTLKPEQKWIAPEFVSSLYHRRGVVAMGRDDNPAESSFTTQFYIVDGTTFTDKQLDVIKAKYKYHFTDEQRQVYKTIGGTPHLDGHYTVFGEIVKGMDLIDKITAVKVDKAGNPETPVWMKLTLLTPRQVAEELK